MGEATLYNGMALERWNEWQVVSDLEPTRLRGEETVKESSCAIRFLDKLVNSHFELNFGELCWLKK